MAKKKLKSPAAPSKFRKLVLDAMRRHCWNIGVSHFKGDILYMDEDDSKLQSNGSTSYVMMSMNTDRRYLRATLKIFPEAIRRWKEDGDETVEKCIAHEVAHIATQHMMDLVVACYKDEGECKDAWESLTETIGRLSYEIHRLKK